MALMQAFQFGASAIDDLFGAKGSKYKAQGLKLQAQSYRDASEYSLRNIDYVKADTEIKTAQAQRNLFSALGQLEADIAGAGFTASGSGGDLLRMSAAEGALEQNVLRWQGSIQEEGFRVQSESYLAQAQAADLAAKAEKKAGKSSTLGGILKIGAAIGSLFL